MPSRALPWNSHSRRNFLDFLLFFFWCQNFQTVRGGYSALPGKFEDVEKWKQGMPFGTKGVQGGAGAAVDVAVYFLAAASHPLSTIWLTYILGFVK